MKEKGCHLKTRMLTRTRQSSSSIDLLLILLATDREQQWFQGRDLGKIEEGGTATHKLGR